MKFNNLSSLSDKELLGKFQEGYKGAYEEIYNRYWGKLYIHACKMLHDEDEAKDVVQELFVTLYTQAFDLEKNSLSAYLYTAVRNKILNIIEHKQVKTNYENSFLEYYSGFQNTTIEQLQEKELAVIVDKEILQLPAKMRQVFELSRIENLSHKEIACQLNISDKTVKKQIGNAIKILRFRLAYLQVLFWGIFYL